MTKRVVVPRLPDATVVKSIPGETMIVDPPAVTAIRVAYGVGPTNGSAPTDDATFKPTYHVAIPVFSIGGLDPDGVYEFDAAKIFDVISKRSLRRAWGVRLELELAQESKTVGGADIFVETPFADDDALAMEILGKTGRGTTLPGGGRRVVLATTIISDAKRVGGLSGIYSVQLRDVPPESEEKPRIRSLARGINVDVTRFEFEG